MYGNIAFLLRINVFHIPVYFVGAGIMIECDRFNNDITFIQIAFIDNRIFKIGRKLAQQTVS